MKGPSAEGPIVRYFSYALAAVSAIWLMVALSAGWPFSAPLAGTLLFGFATMAMYMKEADAEQNRDAIRSRQAKTEQQGDTARWDVEDANADPTVPPRVLES